MNTYKQLAAAAATLSQRCDDLQFTGVFKDSVASVAHTYNPLNYAFGAHEQYLKKYGASKKRVVFLGMNPGPFGMMQTGVPFGEIAAVRDWLKISSGVVAPEHQHPKRPIDGFACRRSEVSGKRLWGWARERFDTAPAFFEQCFVLNYCPLVFLEPSGKNLTPDKLTLIERNALQTVCDEHLREAVRALDPEWLVGIGGFARKRIEIAVQTHGDFAAIIAQQKLRFGQILHPSPQSPMANKGWAAAVNISLTEQGIFSAP